MLLGRYLDTSVEKEKLTGSCKSSRLAIPWMPSLQERELAERNLSWVSHFLDCACEAVEETVKAGCDKNYRGERNDNCFFAELSDDHQKARNNHKTELQWDRLSWPDESRAIFLDGHSSNICLNLKPPSESRRDCRSFHISNWTSEGIVAVQWHG
jgi:hypothetical protein